MTKEEWDEVERKLVFPGSYVCLKIDGYDVSLNVQHLTANKLTHVIMVYVNGLFKGKWLIEECEERKRFFRKSSHDSMSRKLKESLKKEPKSVQKLVNKHNHKHDVYFPYWNSFRSMKSHFIKNNSSIELVRKEMN